MAAASISYAVDPPILSSWYTSNANQYARVVEVTGGQIKTTWPSAGLPNMGGGQSTQAYSDVQQIRYSANYVYINSNGLASHIMGPWYINSTTVFGNWPSAQSYQLKFPRNPTPASGAHTRLGGGNVGLWVNGAGFFNGLDMFSYSTSLANDYSTNGPPGNKGDGLWNRSAIAAEVATFDPAYAHQPGNGAYHYHASPKGLRYQLNDNMTYNSGTNTYSESTGTLHHSPLLGWAFDGYPVYGPYGYSSAMNSASSIARMRTGYAVRNGTNGTTNLSSTGRHTLPAWAATAYGQPQNLAVNQYGPNVTTARPLGWYAEDFDYLGDHSLTQGTDFDLDKYNGRTCVTPEYPSGTYAYFVAIDATGAPAYPFTIGAEYYGTVTGGNAVTISESVTTYFIRTTPAARVDDWNSY
ncbi:MAG: YHYH protein [Candidatus Sumerlaeaceae bacterium]|nr:YHYH protein [Candidatus Sumerlaeaceae bacterium]